LILFHSSSKLRAILRFTYDVAFFAFLGVVEVVDVSLQLLDVLQDFAAGCADLER
jgi:hypothetical protein